MKDNEKWDTQIVEIKRETKASAQGHNVNNKLNHGYEIKGFATDSGSHWVLLTKKVIAGK